MTHRYSLRFETGERRGESVPIAAARFTVGRKPGNSLQIIDNSVSGQHAELVVEPQGVLLRDLGSTNGTRVGLERTLESRLAAGAQIYIGNVGLTLLDEFAPSPLPSAASAGAAASFAGAAASFEPAGPDSAELSVSREDLERAGKGSKSGVLLVVALGALLGAGGWYFLRGEGSGQVRVATPVVPVAGNLLEAGYSFEGGESAASTWTARDGAPAGFFETPAAAVSGSTGLVAELAEGEWAMHVSAEVRVQPGRLLRFGASLAAEAGGSARVGVELFAAEESEDEPGSTPGWMAIWSEAVEGEGPLAVVSEAAVPSGYRRARLVLLGSAPGEGGSVRADDAWLVPQSGGGPSLTLEEFKFYALGKPATVAALYRVEDLLLSGLRARPADASPGHGVTTWQARSVEDGIELAAEGIDGRASLSLRAEDAAVAGGVATIGAEGYLRHRTDFEREAVTDLLLGNGLHLVRLRFAEPVAVSGRSLGRAFHLALEQARSAPFVLQLKFRSELDAAANLARDADQAEAAGRLGTCLAKWQELLDEYPYDERHIARAEETRGRLILSGLEQARAIASQIERARFFRLIDLHRECLANATQLAERFAGSEVEPEARRLGAELEREIALLEVDLDQHEKARLEGILATLEAQGAEGLAGEVRTYLAENFKGSD